MHIHFGIVNYNGGSCLLACVKSIHELQMEHSFSVSVWDNASADDSIHTLEKSSFHVEVLKSSKNLGYAGACNQLINKMDGDLFVLCNMDLEFDAQWGEQIVQAMQKYPDAGAFASLVVEKKTHLINSTGILFYKDFHPQNRHSGIALHEIELPTEPELVFGAYGAVMAVCPWVVQKIGLLQEDYFLFFEETEWFMRMNLTQIATYFVPTAKVLHERSLTTVRYSPLKLYYSERNRLWTVIKYFPHIFVLKSLLYTIQRYWKLQKNGIPNADGSGKKINKIWIMLTLIKAWGAGLLGLVTRRNESKMLSNDKNRMRINAINILKKYEIQNEELSIR
jgi:GT2 family glycosyltransferase